MQKPVRLIIISSLSNREEAPTVSDFLAQVRDFVKVLEGVEQALSETGKSDIEWRITRATTSSPITLEITPFSVDPAVNIDRRVARVNSAVTSGLRQLAQGVDRPQYFTTEVLPSAVALFSRTGQIARTEIQIPDDAISDPIIVDQTSAQLIKHDHAESPHEIIHTRISYREIGSVEGHVRSVERDGRDHSIIRLTDRVGQESIKIRLPRAALKNLENQRIGDIWQGLRVRVYGTITRDSDDRLRSVTAESVEVLDQRRLPSIDEIRDPLFTGGIQSERFLDELRNG